MQDAISTRTTQIEKAIGKIIEQSAKKKQRDFKSLEKFQAWSQSQNQKLNDLYSEKAVLEYPEEYSEVPFAIAAAELGIRLNDFIRLVKQDLVSVSYTSSCFEGSRISREELGRLIEVGAMRLLEIASQSPREIFESCFMDIEDQNVIALQKAYDRIDNDSCINPFALALDVAIQFINEDIDAVESALEFISRRNMFDLAAVLIPLNVVAERLKADTHLMAVVRERVLGVAAGCKDKPFRDSYSQHVGSKRLSQMDENQRRSVYIAKVVMQSIEKYKWVRSIQSTRGFSPSQESEIEIVVGNAILTALEAEATYSTSATAKLFVDSITDLNPKWTRPPQTLLSFSKS